MPSSSFLSRIILPVNSFRSTDCSGGVGKPLSVPLYPARDWEISVIPEKTKSVCVIELNLPPKVSVSNPVSYTHLTLPTTEAV